MKLNFDAPATVHEVMDLMMGIPKEEAGQWLILESERQVLVLEDNLEGDDITRVRTEMFKISSKYETNPKTRSRNIEIYVNDSHISRL